MQDAGVGETPALAGDGAGGWARVSLRASSRAADLRVGGPEARALRERVLEAVAHVGARVGVIGAEAGRAGRGVRIVDALREAVAGAAGDHRRGALRAGVRHGRARLRLEGLR